MATVWINLFQHLGDNLRANLGANLRANLWDNLGVNLRANLGDDLWDNLGVNLRANLGDDLWANLWANLRANLGDNLWANLGDNLRANLGDNLRANLWANLRANLWDNLGVNLGDDLWDNLGDNLRDNQIRYVSMHFWGSFEAYWIAYYLFPYLHIKQIYTSDQVELLNGWATIARNSGLWYPYGRICFVCDRPSALYLDEQGRLHNELGMAMEFSDGYGFYAWHGVCVPERIIMQPETITVQGIVTETNAEIRRVMMFRYGLDRALLDLGAKLLQSDGYGDLYQIILDGQAQKFVRVVNGTPEPDGTYKDYVIPVWADVETAHEAVARTYGRTIAAYAPELRT